MNSDLTQPLHTLRPTHRFSDRAADYARYRPAYPDAAIDAVLEGLARPSDLFAADIGAGTGISARLLADRGVRVIAIEPNDAMRESAASHPEVEYREGTAEQTGLPPHMLDLVFCAQAFHWFAPEPTLREFRRVLKPRGRLALVWNLRDDADPFTAGYRAAIAAAEGPDAVEFRDFLRSADAVEPAFRLLRRLEFPYEQPLVVDALIGRATSASYVPKDGDAFETLRRSLLKLHTRHADGEGLVRMRYRTHVLLFEPDEPT